MSTEVPTHEAFLTLVQKVVELTDKVNGLEIKMSDAEKEAVLVVCNLVKRLAGVEQ